MFFSGKYSNIFIHLRLKTRSLLNIMQTCQVKCCTNGNQLGIKDKIYEFLASS